MRGRATTALIVSVCAVCAVSADAATITPNVFSDGLANNGNCTLREAVQATNLNAPVDACAAGDGDELDTIELGAGEYLLTIPGDIEDLNATGDLDYRPDDGVGPLRIRGEGLGQTTIRANHDDRVIQATNTDDPGSLTMSDLTALGNSDRVLSGGVIHSTNSELVVIRVESANGEAQFGGGISCGTCDRVRILSAFVHDNVASAGGTGAPGVQARGGGISVGNRDVVIRNTTVVDNEAVINDSVAIGGGIFGTGEVEISGSFIEGNSVRSSTNSPISTRDGGGVYLRAALDVPGDFQIVNSTIAGNQANSTGATSQGGGLAVEGSSVAEVFGTTFADSDASQGEQIHAENGATLRVGGSILASIGNSVICSEDGATVRSTGYNVLDLAPVGCMDGPKSANDEIAEPQISFVAFDTGGPTFTYSFVAGSSPAINLVPSSECSAAAKSDQRGVERAIGPGCDAGSYERAVCAGDLIDGSSIIGTPGPDELRGTSGLDVFAPTAGADILSGVGENDKVCGGSGGDTLKGGTGEDVLVGGKGRDDCNGGPDDDTGKSCEVEKSL
jgi:hypothetical protein